MQLQGLEEGAAVVTSFKHGEGQLAAAAHHVTGALRLHLLSHMQKRLRRGCVVTQQFCGALQSLIRCCFTVSQCVAIAVASWHVCLRALRMPT